MVFELRCPLLSGLAPPCALMDDWAACDAEAVVTALSVRFRFSRANAVQLLRDQGILLQREAAAEPAADTTPSMMAAVLRTGGVTPSQ